MFEWSGCASTSCGVGQKDANGVCIFTTLAPTLRPTPAPTPTPIVDAAHRLSCVSAALLVLANRSACFLKLGRLDLGGARKGGGSRR